MKILLGDEMKKVMIAVALAAFAATPALAAKAKSKTESPPPPPAPTSSWAGCYVGVNGGYGWNNGRTHYNDPNTVGDPINFVTADPFHNTFVPTPSGTGGAGGLGGGGVGCNWQSQQWVYGVEADIDGGRIAGSQTNFVANTSGGIGVSAHTFLGFPSVASATEHSQLDWLSTIRGRIGLAIQDRLLLFATGGLALGGVSSQGSVTAGTTAAQIIWSGSHSAVNAGVTAGGGAEWAFADRWTAKAEYLWYDLGNVSHALNCASTTFLLTSCSGPNPFPTLGNAVSSIHGSIVRFGINYRFN